MIEQEILVVADAVAASIFGVGFLVAFLFNRKLKAFVWWSVFFGLISISLAATVFDPNTVSVLHKTITWLTLFCAVSVGSWGFFRQGELPSSPMPEIASSALLFCAMIAGLAMLDASYMAWVLIGPLPSLPVILGMGVRVLARHPIRMIDWATGFAILLGIVLIGARSIWLATSIAATHSGPVPSALPPGLPSALYGPMSPLETTIPPVEEPLIIALATILVLLGLAVTAILRETLKVVEGMMELSRVDALSGLLNRAAFDEQATQAIKTSANRPLCAIMLDIDYFKNVNDTCGHPAGDRVIAALGSILREATNDNQIAARIGGEEFAVVLPDSNLSAAHLFAEAVRTRFSACDFGDEIPWTITLSAGVAEHRKGEPLHALIARADKALYFSKNHGRNRCAMAPEMDYVPVANRA